MFIQEKAGFTYLLCWTYVQENCWMGYLSQRFTDEIVLNAIKQAVKQRRPEAACIFHSDRGSQYDSEKVRNYLKRHGFLQSMSKKGNCYDNAITETFFYSLKTEKLKFEKFQN